MKLPRRRAIGVTLLLAVLGLVGLGWWVRAGPLPDGVLAGLDESVSAPSVQLFDRHGEWLYEARSSRGTRGLRLAPDEIPPLVAAATLAAEDRRFPSHWGVDLLAIARATRSNLRAGRVVEGGSTISQQVVSLLEARQGRAPARTLFGKAREAVLAMRLEHRLSKDQILARYLELAPYGNQVEGMARASTFYFNRPIAELTAAQAAYLAALPQQPGRFNPRRDVARAFARQHRILAAMEESGVISAVEAHVAREERIALARPGGAGIAQHFVDQVLRQTVRDDRHEHAGGPSGVVTTLDAPLQRAVLGILRAHHDTLEAHAAHNVAVAVLDNRTGEWLAWEGSGDYFDVDHSGAIDGVTAPRQPGSALKPFTYAAAFERGWHPGRVLPDVPSEFPTAEPGVFYRPRNYDGQYRGPLRARVALAGSENVPAVALASEIGVPVVAALLRRAGLSTLDKTAAHYGLGLTLGNAEVQLDELVAAYAMIARGGLAVRPTLVRAGGEGLPAGGNARAERLISERTAFWVTDILADREARQFAFGQRSSLDFPFAVAAKTGTSQAYHDNWTVGFTREVTVGVWVGNFDRTPLRRSSGVTGAGPIFHDVMLAAVERVRGALPLFDPAPVAEPPVGLHEVTLCALSGMAASDACPVRTHELLPDDVVLDECEWHHASDRGVVVVWPEPYRTWARVTGSPGAADGWASASAGEGADVARAGRSAESDEQVAALRIADPAPGTIYLLDPTLRAEFQAVSLRALGAVGRVDWFVNEARIGASVGDASLSWPLQRGAHTILARDANGRSASVPILVK